MEALKIGWRVRRALRSGLFAALLALVLPLPAHAGEASAPTPLRFGVLNQQSAIQTAERWNPILRYLSQKTGIPLRLIMAPTVQETDAMMGRGEFDLIYTNHNFQPEYDGKYQVLARWAGKPVHGALVVHEDAPLRSLSDLQGKTVAFPSEDAFLAYAVPMVALREAGVGITPRFSGHQDAAMAQFKARLVDAAAVNSRFLEAYARREQLGYRLLYMSEPFHELPVLIHPRVPARQATLLRRAMLGMARDPAAATLLATGCRGFEPAREDDYANVRRVYRALKR